ncbi:hypothetical protein FB382_002799 [Nocardioides ginsengisegetis]|uniref:SnoaL-like domain-containing protein n=1 Tax=Nocardioides ginsengisegetis TaxID=661491 RepID=A0A7W3PAE0_9ACTN|nr:hypothetical protein [Nocardioides ginsengisegetis]MBA8804508.1 hypothetical protein [Nocardioides ginsengisegetis]
MTVTAEEKAGTAFARALVAKDRDAVLEVLAPDLDFRGVTPGRAWEAGSAEAFVDEILLGTWFSPEKTFDSLEDVRTAEVAHRHSVTYRMRLTLPEGPHVCEQHAYYEVTDGRISWLRIVCSGILPLT